jgi:hypothetical protein
MKKLPIISDSAFWDVSLNKDSKDEFEKYSSYIIQKVFDFGTLNDIIQIVKYYGKKRVKKEITQVNLKEKTISLCCVLFNLKKTNFKCYRQRQLSPKLWNY